MKKYISICLTLILMSCNNFVDIVPKGQTIPETVDDLAKMLNNSGATRGSEVQCCLSDNITLYSDDYTVTENPESWMYAGDDPVTRNVCSWTDYIYTDVEDDGDWNRFYKSNYILNYVINHIDEVQEGMTYRRNEIKGQALVHRALNFFLLVNVYGKQWNAQTAGTDLGVPLMLEGDINKQEARATVAQVYERIFDDLNEALTLLEEGMPQYAHIPGRAAAYALRSRVWLWQQNYDKAYEDAVEALKIRRELIDYNTCSLYDEEEGPIMGVDGYDEDHTVNIESLYARSWMSNGIGSLMYSPAMESIIDKEHDLRYKLFMGTFDGMFFYTLMGRMNYSGIQVSEVWLTKAEAALRKSQPNIPEAIEALDYVRQHRYDNFQATTFTDKKQLLTEILNERRREIIFNEMSFLDRKRQNADPETARPMTRTVFGKTYTLPVGDPHYQLPIPLNVMNMNKLLIQNER